MACDGPVLVLDTGGYTIKLGLAGDANPIRQIPSLASGANSDSETMTFGHAAYATGRYSAVFESPFTRWSDTAVELWRNALQYHTHCDSILLSMRCFDNINNNQQRMNALEVFIEHLQFSRVCIASPAVLAVYGAGRWTGLVVDSGFSATSLVAVYERCVLPQSVLMLPNIDGKSVSAYLAAVAHKQLGTQFTPTSFDERMSKSMKESCCYVSPTPVDRQAQSHSLILPEDDISLTNALLRSLNGTHMNRLPLELIKIITYYKEAAPKSFVLPDGKTFTLSEERYLAPELIFQPCDEDGNSLAAAIHRSIMKCDPCIRRDFFRNVTLTGGNTNFPGFERRLLHDLTPFALDAVSSPPRLTAAKIDRSLCTWKGGSMFASSEEANKHFITRAEYDEEGPVMALRKYL